MAKRPTIGTYSEILERGPDTDTSQDTDKGVAAPLKRIGRVPMPTPKRRRTATDPTKGAVLIRMRKDDVKVLNMIAKENGITLQDLGLYGVNCALAAFNSKHICKPPGDDD